uniref:Uncharacterized protein n=1 Tax=Anguilla anguilla TaxID=7936 RepID=A0A0E9PKK2_ANGAN
MLSISSDSCGFSLSRLIDWSKQKVTARSGLYVNNGSMVLVIFLSLNYFTNSASYKH